MFSYGKFTTVSGEQRRKILFRTNYELGSVVLFCLFIGKHQKFPFLWRHLAREEPSQVRQVTAALSFIMWAKVDELRLPEQKNIQEFYTFQDFWRWVLPFLTHSRKSQWCDMATEEALLACERRYRLLGAWTSCSPYRSCTLWNIFWENWTTFHTWLTWHF